MHTNDYKDLLDGLRYQAPYMTLEELHMFIQEYQNDLTLNKEQTKAIEYEIALICDLVATNDAFKAANDKRQFLELCNSDYLPFEANDYDDYDNNFNLCEYTYPAY